MNKHVARYKDRVNRAIFNSPKRDDFGDERLERQYEEVEQVSKGLKIINNAITDNHLYSKHGVDGTDIERKHQKYPTYKVAKALHEAANKLSPAPSPAAAPGDVKSEYDEHIDHALCRLYKNCAAEFENMSKQTFHFESEVNANVVVKLCQSLQVSDSLSSQLQKLQKHVVDQESTRNKLEDTIARQQKLEAEDAVKASDLATKRASYEEAKSSIDDTVAHDRSLLSQGVQNFIRDEAEIANTLITYVEMTRQHHKLCMEILDRLVPVMEECRNLVALSPPFETDLAEHLQQTGRKIAYPIEACGSWLHHQKATRDEGVFRIGGNKKAALHLQEKFDRYTISDEDFLDSALVTSCLKSYLRSLPESLFTQSGLDAMKQIIESNASKPLSEAELTTKFKDIISKLPQANYDNLKFMFCLLSEVLSHSSTNKMNADNLATCIGPSFDPGKLVGADLASLSLPQASNTIVRHIIKNTDTIFDTKTDPVVFRELKDIIGMPTPVYGRSQSSGYKSTDTSPLQRSKKTGNFKRSSSSERLLNKSTESPKPPNPIPPKPIPPSVSTPNDKNSDGLGGGLSGSKKKAPRPPVAATATGASSRGAPADLGSTHDEVDSIGGSADNLFRSTGSVENLSSGGSVTSTGPPERYSVIGIELGAKTLPSDSPEDMRPKPRANPPKPKPRSFNTQRPTVAPPPPPPLPGSTTPEEPSNDISLSEAGDTPQSIINSAATKF